MTIDETIRHCEEVAESKSDEAKIVCCGCGKKSDNNGIRIEGYNPEMQRRTIIYFCSECWKDYYLPLSGMSE